ncbi:hypothetical protein [Olivibacter ginsenosidimutans]
MILIGISVAHLSAQQREETFTIAGTGADGTDKLVLQYDSSGFPSVFFQDIFTPVCLDNVCKPVRIKLFWDLLGNYIQYEVPLDEPLTKLDHQEFTPADYEKLQQILANDESLLKQLKMEELMDSTTQRLSDSVDAVTGATKNTVKGEVIEGALYTCYTLWHLVHGQVVDEIHQVMQTKLDEQMLHRFLKSTNFHYVHFALDEVMDKQGMVQKGFLPDVLAVLESNHIFAARRVAQEINLRYFTAGSEQEKLWVIFTRSAYSQQVVLLRRMTGLTLDTRLVEEIANYLPKLNQALFKQGVSLLAHQENLSPPIQEKLMAYLKSTDQQKAQVVYQAMNGKNQLTDTAKKQLNAYRKQQNQL